MTEDVRVITNAGRLAKAYVGRANAVPAGVARGVLKVVTQVEINAEFLLRGAGSEEPGAFPVPVRTGFTRRSLGSSASGGRGVVFSQARHASAISEGFQPYGNPNATPIPARPFLAVALDRTDTALIMGTELERAL